MCRVLSLLSLRMLSTLLSLVFCVSSLPLESALYLASFSSDFSSLMRMSDCWHLYRLDMYTIRNPVMSRISHICFLRNLLLRKSPPMIFLNVMFFVGVMSSSRARSRMMVRSETVSSSVR